MVLEAVFRRRTLRIAYVENSNLVSVLMGIGKYSHSIYRGTLYLGYKLNEELLIENTAPQ